MQDLRLQYDSMASDFSSQHRIGNQVNRNLFQRMVTPYLRGNFVLDLCCGDGVDADFYARQGAYVVGLDASMQLVQKARQDYPYIKFNIGLAENLPYIDEEFDCVFSKYAIQTSSDIAPVFNEVYRVLRKGGVFVYLVTHPLRQFLEKNKLQTDYFVQEVVESRILNGQVSLFEPTHTFSEYFNASFFEKFEMVDYIESFDPAAEKIGMATYPGFFIVVARKK